MPSSSAGRAAARAGGRCSPPTARPAWQFDLGEFALRDASISAEDRRTKPAAKVLIAPLSLKVTGASLDLAKPVNVALDTKINDTGTLNVTGEITPQPVAANLKLKLDGIELAAVQPYIAQYTSMTLLAGGWAAMPRYATARSNPRCSSAEI